MLKTNCDWNYCFNHLITSTHQVSIIFSSLDTKKPLVRRRRARCSNDKHCSAERTWQILRVQRKTGFLVAQHLRYQTETTRWSYHIKSYLVKLGVILGRPQQIWATPSPHEFPSGFVFLQFLSDSGYFSSQDARRKLPWNLNMLPVGKRRNIDPNYHFWGSMDVSFGGWSSRK